MLTPVPEHDLLLFWLQLALLLAVARGLGSLAQRVGQPAVVGELGAGLLLGPSVLGRIAPGFASWLFPGDEVVSALLLAVSWLGIVLLLAVTGFETDLRLLRRLGRASAGVTVGSLVVPLGVGFGLGLLLPDAYLGDPGARLLFAGFMAVALSISALPVIAKILGDMRLMRRDFGQITVAAGMVNDLVGWLLLGVLIGLVNEGGFDPVGLGTTLVLLALFIGGAFTVGARGIDAALRRARMSNGFSGPLTVTLLAIVTAGAATHAIGMEAVIGAFIVGIVLGRSRYLPDEIAHTIEHLSNSVFAPVFFATAGLYVDLGTLIEPSAALAAFAILAAAAVAKLVGSYAGGRLSGLSRMESLAAGIGLNARGAMEIVLATIGLRVGVLNEVSYSAVVLMAMATSMAAPPLLRPVLSRLEATPEETERLEREETLEGSVIAKARTALLPTRGGHNSRMAARILDLVLQPEAHVTVLSAADPGRDGAEAVVRQVEDVFHGRAVDHRGAVHEDPVTVITTESRLGYDLVALGLNEDFRGTHELSPLLQGLLAGCATPMLLVRRGLRHSGGVDFGEVDFTRVLVPVPGTVAGRAAEELAYTLAARVDAEVDALHVISRPDRSGPVVEPSAVGQLSRARTLAERFGRGVSAVVRVAPTAYEEIVAAAEERDADIVVLGTQLRRHEDGRPFLGHGTEYVLEHARQTVVVVVFPEEQ